MYICIYMEAVGHMMGHKVGWIKATDELVAYQAINLDENKAFIVQWVSKLA